MHIQINTADELTEQDRAILLALAGVTETLSGVLLAEEAKPETPKKRAPRKPKEADAKVDADAAMLAKHASSAIGVVDEPTEEALDEAVDEAIEKHNAEIEKPSEPEEPKVDPKELINDAAERAVKLIRSGKRDEVKAILDRLGLEKVTALKDSPEQVQPFLDAISALEAKDD